MEKLYKYSISKKTLLRLIGIFTTISTALALILTFIIGNGKSRVVVFSDNMFMAGTILFIVSIFFNLKHLILVMTNKSLSKKVREYESLQKENKSKKEYKEVGNALTDKEEAIITKKQLFKRRQGSLLVSGIICFLISIIFSILA